MNIDKLKQKILDLAIIGKLVPQDPNDEPASVLIDRIREEKKKLIKQGKIKAEKEESYIYKGSDNCYYENNKKIKFIEPLKTENNIVWIKGKDFILPMESIKPKGEYFNYIDIDSIDNKNNIVKDIKKILVQNAPSRASRKVYSSSTLFSMVRPYLRNIAKINKEYENCIASTGFYVCSPMSFVDENYLFLLMTSNYVVNSLNNFMKGDNSPSINKHNLEDLYYPIPSIKYQRKIVNIIRKIFSAIDKIRLNYLELDCLIKQLKTNILNITFGENSSYKSYYEKEAIIL